MRGGAEKGTGEQQAWAVEWKKTRQWKGALGRLRRTGGKVGERDRLVRVVAEARGKVWQRERGDLANVVWGLGGNCCLPMLMRSG